MMMQESSATHQTRASMVKKFDSITSHDVEDMLRLREDVHSQMSFASGRASRYESTLRKKKISVTAIRFIIKDAFKEFKGHILGD